MRRIFSFTAASVLSLILLNTGCSSSDGVPAAGDMSFDENQAEIHKIINGSPALGKKYDPVVTVIWKGSSICSGTLISDRFILTAAHCVYLKQCKYNELGQPKDCLLESDPSGYKIYLGEKNWSGPRQIRTPVKIFGHPEYDDSEYTNDIALLKIDEPFENVIPIPALPDEDGLRWTEDDVDKPITYVGFGRTENNEIGIRLMVESTVGKICLGDTSCGVARSKTVCNFKGDSGITCNGDSGGPLLLQRGDTIYVAGVTSYGDMDCNSYGCSTAVSPFAAWLAECMGGDGIENGGDCVQGSQCRSGICSLGVCCNQVCTDSPCQSCSAFRGRPQESHGVCGNTNLSCDDNNACTVDDRCEDGICMPGSPKECPAADSCNAASVCEIETGSCIPRQPLPNGTVCDDGNACTLDDTCFEGACISSGKVSCLNIPCRKLYGAGCMPSTGECKYVDLPDGEECVGSDGKQGVCMSGVCEGSGSSGCGVIPEGGASETGANDCALLLSALLLFAAPSFRRKGAASNQRG